MKGDNKKELTAAVIRSDTWDWSRKEKNMKSIDVFSLFLFFSLSRWQQVQIIYMVTSIIHEIRNNTEGKSR